MTEPAMISYRGREIDFSRRLRAGVFHRVLRRKPTALCFVNARVGSGTLLAPFYLGRNYLDSA